jgi:hypothetical protein
MADAKLKSGTFTVRNTSPGVRGFYDVESGYVELEPGKSASGVRFTEAEYESTTRTAAFDIGTGDAPAADDQADDTPAGAKAYADITAKDIKAHLDAQNPPVAYESDANKAALYALYTGTFAAPASQPVTPPPGDTLDKMSDDDLRDTVKALTGEDAPADADRDALLALARGEA